MNNKLEYTIKNTILMASALACTSAIDTVSKSVSGFRIKKGLANFGQS